MGFRRSDLQEAFSVSGTHAFRVWGYGTSDPLEEVLRRNYFELASGLLRPGELIYVSSCPQGSGSNRAAPNGPRMALVVVGADERNPERAGGSVRLVQDFGRPGDSPVTLDLSASAQLGALGPPAPIKRSRGRPRGSGNRKPAQLMQTH
jgi:hypothetical protein